MQAASYCEQLIRRKTRTMKKVIASMDIQTMKKMTTTLALGLTALTLAGTAVAKDQQTRPYFAHSHHVVTVDLVTGTWTAVNEGHATHLGHFTGEAMGTLSPLGEGFFIEGDGVITAANGDQVFTHFENPDGEEEGAPPVQYFTDGTGRFENAFGSGVQTQYNVVYDYSQIDVGILTITYDDVIIGTITY